MTDTLAAADRHPREIVPHAVLDVGINVRRDCAACETGDAADRGGRRRGRGGCRCRGPGGGSGGRHRWPAPHRLHAAASFVAGALAHVAHRMVVGLAAEHRGGVRAGREHQTSAGHQHADRAMLPCARQCVEQGETAAPARPSFTPRTACCAAVSSSALRSGLFCASMITKSHAVRDARTHQPRAAHNASRRTGFSSSQSRHEHDSPLRRRMETLA